MIEGNFRMIVCLGWGSLIWNQKNLKVMGEWSTDGPSVAVEFTRQSNNGRLTLVINEGSEALPVLWAKMDVDTLEEAIDNLRDREETAKRYIGHWVSGNNSPSDICELADWAESKSVKAVVWTALPPRFRDENGTAPSIHEAIEYLLKLNPDKREPAEEYVRKTPLQIRTKYRVEFEEKLGWTPTG